MMQHRHRHPLLPLRQRIDPHHGQDECRPSPELRRVERSHDWLADPALDNFLLAHNNQPCIRTRPGGRRQRPFATAKEEAQGRISQVAAVCSWPWP
jgi:hypothetical protein